MFDEIISWVVANIPNAIQVFLNVPKEERRLRDVATKQLFLNQEMNDEHYDIPSGADLVINNYGEIDIECASTQIINHFIGVEDHELDRGRTPYWNHYYGSDLAPSRPSSYCRFVCANLNEGDHLLEIGCGNGRDAVHFSMNDVNVTAIDRSETAIQVCKRKYSDLPVKFFSGTIDNVPEISKHTYDAIYARFVIHAMPLGEEISLLQQCINMLNDNGHLYIECRSINDALARKGEIISPTERIHGHYRRFIVLDELRKRLATIGYRIVDEIEEDDLAVFGDENPVIIRITATVNNVSIRRSNSQV